MILLKIYFNMDSTTGTSETTANLGPGRYLGMYEDYTDRRAVYSDRFNYEYFEERINYYKNKPGHRVTVYISEELKRRQSNGFIDWILNCWLSI
jgi:hypothetical protein